MILLFITIIIILVSAYFLIQKCSVGSFFDQTSMTCKLCSTGTYNSISVIGGTCSTCPAGTFTDVEGSSICTKCPAGTFNDTLGATSKLNCTNCPAGTFSIEGSSSCTNCPAGTFRDEGSLSCTKCSAGTFSLEGSSICTKCPGGTFSNVEGSSSCTKCNAGSFVEGVGNSSCTLCPSGTFNNNVGSTSCQTCPNLSYALSPGSTECINCSNEIREFVPSKDLACFGSTYKDCIETKGVDMKLCNNYPIPGDLITFSRNIGGGGANELLNTDVSCFDDNIQSVLSKYKFDGSYCKYLYNPSTKKFGCQYNLATKTCTP